MSFKKYKYIYLRCLRIKLTCWPLTTAKRRWINISTLTEFLVSSCLLPGKNLVGVWLEWRTHFSSALVKMDFSAVTLLGHTVSVKSWHKPHVSDLEGEETTSELASCLMSRCVLYHQARAPLHQRPQSVRQVPRETAACPQGTRALQTAKPLRYQHVSPAFMRKRLALRRRRRPLQRQWTI